MSEMVERLRLVVMKRDTDRCSAMGDCRRAGYTQCHCEQTAIAIIKALREPTKAMVHALQEGECLDRDAKDFNDSGNHYYDPERFWRNFVDLMLLF